MGCKTNYSVAGILKVECQSCLCGILLMSLVVECFLLLVHHETLIGIDIEEHDEEVVLISVSAVILVASTVTLEEHTFSTQNPMRV